MFRAYLSNPVTMRRQSSMPQTKASWQTEFGAYWRNPLNKSHIWQSTTPDLRYRT
jgi:hypothetical protein